MTQCPRCGASNRPGANHCCACGSSLGAPCPRCGALNRAGAGFCRGCGGRLAAGPDWASPAVACPHCHYPNQPQAKFCAHCGRSLLASTELCPHCRRPLLSHISSCPYCHIAITRCPHCGGSNRSNARNCRACGRSLLPGPRMGSGDLSPGRHLSGGRYEIQTRIAQGGMSAVYKAQDSRLSGRVVAIKEMNERVIEPKERPQVLDAFKREAEMLSQLDHPNLVKVFDLFEESGRHYMVMELIQGCSLLDILEKEGAKGLAEDRVLAWAGQLCDVLAYLHGQQPKIIYRDMKPGNVMELVGTTHVKLIDFGIARLYKPGKRKDTITFGTEGFASPEQFGSGQTDERSDVYSLGATLHQVLTGHDPSSKLFTFPSVLSLKPGVSQRVNDAIVKAVAMRREDRFASMLEMKQALLGDTSFCLPPSPTAPSGRKPATPPAAPAKPCPPSKAKPKPAGAPLSLSPARLDFGQALKGRQPSRKFSVTDGGAGASLSADQAWLAVQPAQLSRDQADVQVTLHTELMSLGRQSWPVAPHDEGVLNRVIEIVLRIAMAHARFIVPVARPYQGKVTVRSKAGERLEVMVTATLAPQTWHILLGWAGVVGAMLLETLLIGLVIGALLGGCGA